MTHLNEYKEKIIIETHAHSGIYQSCFSGTFF